MSAVFTIKEVTDAIQRAGQKYPPLTPGSLSPQVNLLVGVYGNMTFLRAEKIAIDDQETIDLLSPPKATTGSLCS